MIQYIVVVSRDPVSAENAGALSGAGIDRVGGNMPKPMNSFLP